MAEARSAITYHQGTHAHLLFQVTEEEVVLRINKGSLNALASFLKRMAFRLAIRTRNRIINALHPAPPLPWTLLVAAPAALMLSPPASSPRLLALSATLWTLRRFLPFSHVGPLLSPAADHVASALTIAVGVGTLWALVLSGLRRVLLRTLFTYQGWLDDAPGCVSWKTRLWGICVHVVSGNHPFRLFPPRRPLLFSLQGTLPRLPVPRLASTLHKYLLSVQPLLSPDEFMHMQELVASFQKKEGRKLQRYLILKSWFTQNYITDWWEKYVYLRGRSPILINSNYYALDSGVPLPPTSSQVSRAASIISNMLKFKDDLEHERIAPLILRGLVPMCMSQYERMFGTTRIPGKEMDRIIHDDYSTAEHVVVFRKGVQYLMLVYDDAGKALSPHEIEVQLKWIMQDAEKEPAGEAEGAIPALTGEQRTVWARVREEHFCDITNKASLDAIEKSLFWVCLDDVILKENDWTAQGRSLLHGNGHNRWSDKSLCVVVFPNGKAGLHVEHSWADAPVVGHLWEYVVIMDQHPSTYGRDGHVIRPPLVLPRPHPRRLRWALSSQAETCIQQAKERVSKQIEDLDLEVVCYSRYGKRFIKGCRISPDAYVQIAMLIASRRDLCTFPLTYESAMTRLFSHGRTETIRPVTLEAVQFVNAFLDPGVPIEEKVCLLKKAGKAHQHQTRECLRGRGIDRHLFGLHVVAQGMGIDSAFLQKAQKMEWQVSSSQQPQGQTGMWDPSGSAAEAAKVSPGGGFGPVSPNGYGVSYQLAGDECLFFHVSSLRSSPLTLSARYASSLFSALDDLFELFSSLRELQKNSPQEK